MNGALAMMETATAAGAEVCFANPGTTEMGMVRALDEVPGLRAVLGLFEGVCTGAADGYGRMAGRPALTVLHLGPGLANGLANLHNARRARSPIVNLVGEHATWHRAADAPLNSDIDSLARPVSGWVRRCASSESLARDTAAAVAAAAGPPGKVATLIVPSDLQDGPASGPAKPHAPSLLAAPEGEVLENAARRLREERCALLLGADALTETGLRFAGALASGTGARLFAETFVARAERGRSLCHVERLPYFPEAALAALDGTQTLLLVGARSPVAFFGYEGVPSSLVPEGCAVLEVAGPGRDSTAALEELARELGAAERPYTEPRCTVAEGPLDPDRLGRTLAAVQPEGAIVVDESATSGGPYAGFARGAPHHTVLQLTGGSIGQGLPCATGAAVACPDRPVIAFQADGSGMYTAQALWTQAREGLDVTTVLCSNRSYRILRVELARAGVQEPGEKADSLTDLSQPDIDWTLLARGLGVPAVRVERAEELGREIERAVAEPGPHLIEAVL